MSRRSSGDSGACSPPSSSAPPSSVSDLIGVGLRDLAGRRFAVAPAMPTRPHAAARPSIVENFGIRGRLGGGDARLIHKLCSCLIAQP